MTAKRTGAQIIWDVLKDEEVEYIFGVPGSTETPLITSMGRAPEIKYILSAHESVSAGMADGYARTNGKLGVVMVHTAPGVANVVGNLYNAYRAGTPLLFIVGQQDATLENRDPRLDIDLQPMVSEISKGYWKVNRIQDLPVILSRAIKEANTLPKGPVFVVVPGDIQREIGELDIIPAQSRRPAMNVRPDAQAIKQAAMVLVEAKGPVILANHEVPDADAIPELVKLSETIGAAVFVMEEMRLTFPTNHPLYYGYAPCLCDAYRQICANADVVLALGKDVFTLFDYQPTPFINPETKLIHIDIDPSGLAKTYPTDISLVGNLKIALDEIIAGIVSRISPERKEELAQRARELAATRSKMRSDEADKYNPHLDDVPISSWRAFKEIAAVMPPDGAVILECPILMRYATKHFQFNERGIYYNSAAYLGWGIPGALGTCLATQNRPVMAVVGDGSALFGIQALWTAARYDLPVVTVVLNNAGYGAIRGFAELYAMATQQSIDVTTFDIGDPHIDRQAEAYGIEARRVEDPAALKGALEWAADLGRPAVVEIMVDPTDVGIQL